MTCDEARELLPAFAGRGDTDLALRRHLARCPGCRAEAARYERLEGALEALRARVVEAPPGLAVSLAAIPAQQRGIAQVRTHVARNRRAYAGGAALALAAAGALWRVRSRRLAAA